MKIEVESFYHGGVSLLDVGAEHVTIREAYTGVHLVTEDGEELGVSMRDTGFEVIYLADGRRADLVLKNGSVDAQGDVQSVCDEKSLEGVDRRLSEVEHYVGQLLNIPGENAALRDEVTRLKAAILEHERRTKEIFPEDITGFDTKLWAVVGESL